ncbi:hypothetical protein PQX77_007297 [Marasmius sp. AFHP31]|nr:hypothetical protein PQX77_007297 [Marasmius sp. AFHP31]
MLIGLQGHDNDQDLGLKQPKSSKDVCAPAQAILLENMPQNSSPETVVLTDNAFEGQQHSSQHSRRSCIKSSSSTRLHSPNSDGELPEELWDVQKLTPLKGVQWAEPLFSTKFFDSQSPIITPVDADHQLDDSGNVERGNDGSTAKTQVITFTRGPLTSSAPSAQLPSQEALREASRRINLIHLFHSKDLLHHNLHQQITETPAEFHKDAVRSIYNEKEEENMQVEGRSTPVQQSQPENNMMSTENNNSDAMEWETNDFGPNPRAASEAGAQVTEQSTGTLNFVSQTYLPTPVSEHTTPEPFACTSHRSLQRDVTPFLASDPPDDHPEPPLSSPTRLPTPSPEPGLPSHDCDEKCHAGATYSTDNDVDANDDEENLGHNEQAGDEEEDSDDSDDSLFDELVYPSDLPSSDRQHSATPTSEVEEIPQTIRNHAPSGVDEGKPFTSNVASNDPRSLKAGQQTRQDALRIVGRDEDPVSPISPTNSTLSTDSSSSVPLAHAAANHSPVAAPVTASRNYIQIYTRDQKKKRKQRPKANDDLTEHSVKRPRILPYNQVTAGPSTSYSSTAAQLSSPTPTSANPLFNIHKPTKPRPTVKPRLTNAKEAESRPRTIARSIAVSNPKPLQTSTNFVPATDTHGINVQLAQWHGVLGRMCYKLKGNQEEMADRDEVDGVFREMLMMKDAFVKAARNHDSKCRENWNVPKLREQLEFFTSEETEAYGESVQGKARRILDMIGNGKAASLPMTGMSG